MFPIAKGWGRWFCRPCEVSWYGRDRCWVCRGRGVPGGIPAELTSRKVVRRIVERERT